MNQLNLYLHEQLHTLKAEELQRELAVARLGKEWRQRKPLLQPVARRLGRALVRLGLRLSGDERELIVVRPKVATTYSQN